MEHRTLGDPEFCIMIEEEKRLCEKDAEFIKGILKKGIGEKDGKLVDKDTYSPSVNYYSLKGVACSSDYNGCRRKPTGERDLSRTKELTSLSEKYLIYEETRQKTNTHQCFPSCWMG